MLITLFHLLAPVLSDFAYVIVEFAIFGIILIFGFSLLFSSIGVKVNATSASIGTFRYVLRKLTSCIGWLCKNFFNILPWIYKKLKSYFIREGLDSATSKVLSFVFTIIIVVLII